MYTQARRVPCRSQRRYIVSPSTYNNNSHADLRHFSIDADVRTRFPLSSMHVTGALRQRVCARAENHFADGLRFEESDTASATTGGHSEFDLARWQTGFKPAQTNMLRQMYYL